MRTSLIGLAGAVLFCAALARAGHASADDSAFLVATDYPSIQAAIYALPEAGGTVYLRGDVSSTQVIALRDEGGVRRTYLGPAGCVGLLNLPFVDVKRVVAPRKGDLILVDGKPPRLAVFDGEKWIYFDASE